MIRSPSWTTSPHEDRFQAGRLVAALVLRRVGAMLARWGRRLTLADRGRARAAELPLLEFHAEAGAPEGALFIDGRYAGHIDVNRL